MAEPASPRAERLRGLTPAQRAALVAALREERARKGGGGAAVPRRPPGSPVPLSLPQQRLWFLEQLEPGGSGYHIPDAYRLRGRLDRGALAQSLNEIARRHEALRTRFGLVAGQPVQVVDPPAPVPLPLADLSPLAPAAREAEALRLAGDAAWRAFDLDAGPLWRALLLRLGEAEHVLVLVFHHLVSDGWSAGVFWGELAALYAAFAAGRPSPLPALPIQYGDFARWQRERWEAGEMEGQLAAWKERLANSPPVIPLPVDRHRPPVQTRRGAVLPFALPADLSERLEALGRELGATPFMLHLAAWQALLHRVTGQEDLLVAVPAANRRPPETEPLIGFFVNTLVMRADLKGDPSFAALLARTREAVLAAQEHAEVPFEKLVEALRPERDPSHHPLVQVMFAFETGAPGAPALAGLVAERFQLPAAVAPLDLALTAASTGGMAGGLRGWWVYSTDLFDTTTVLRLREHWRSLLAGIAGAPAARLSDLPLLSEEERHQMLVEWNDTGGAVPPFKRFDDLFAARAREAPDAIALDIEGGAISYGELARRAGWLAGRLEAAGAGPEVRVGVFLERSAELVIALLAVLEAGGVYLPLDVDYPPERLAFMLEDSGAPLVVTRESLTLRLPAVPSQLVLLDAEPEATEGIAEEGGAPPGGGGDNAAYTIYTSGSTGRPKGVVVTHRNLVNLAAMPPRRFGLGPGDRFLQFASPSFDASVFEIVVPLAAGATLVVTAREATLPGPDLTRLLAERRVTGACLPPSALAVLPVAPLPDLRLLISAGEDVSSEVFGRWRRDGRFLFNGYGPTEATVAASGAPCPRDGRKPTIGRGLLNAALYVLDRRLGPAAINVPGELCVGGAGVSRGYLGRPDLTAGRFLPAPFAARPGARMYRTGDLVRWRPAGELEFLGRVDHQVKLRGFRVEPGEVEAALRRRPEVRDAVVAHEAGRLVAYVVAREGVAGAELAARLRGALERELPAHLVPSAVVPLAALPLTPNGKVDRRALPAPSPHDEEDAAGAAPPAFDDATEAWVAAIWREVLGTDRVGPDDSFFDLGGHSLLMIGLHARLLERTPGLPLVDLFRHPTVRAQAARLRRGERPAPRPAPAALPEPATDRAVAVIGLAGRFPGAADVEELWQNLERGVESITFFSAEDLAAAGVDRAWLEHPRYVRANGVLAGADLFDAELFGFTAREAEVLDPQHRLLLEAAWEALESAGRPPGEGAGRVGVFVGVSANTYLNANVRRNREALEAAGELQATIANGEAFAATRLSYKLGLEGPSVHVQTACSTSLVAVHLACRSLLAGECDLALAGGAGVMLPQEAGYFYQERGIASPDGHCRAFDARAAGTVGGNGVGLVVLKRLAAALADGDPVRAVILGSAVNNDGARRVGYTAPGVEGQAEVIAAALAAAGVAPETIGYVEAHGSGTQLGDPIEIAALEQAFRAGTEGADRPRGSCAVGSIKTNIGHLDAAAGVAGLIKAVLALEHRVQPPSLHFERPNPAIDFAASSFFVPTRAVPWPRGEAPRRAGVSSFGIGGTNAHVVLEEAPERPPTPAARPWQLLVLSARTARALDRATARLAAHLARHPGLDLADVAWTLQVGRRALPHRRALVARDLAGAVAALSSGDPEQVMTAVATVAPGRRSVAMLFPGLGDVRPGAFGELYATEPAFRDEVDRCAELLRPHLEIDLRPLFAAAPEPRPAGGLDLRRLARGGGAEETAEAGPWSRTEVAQPALFVAEHALARLWLSWGIPVTALLGYSLGEYAAACLAGVMTLEDALRVVALRARLLGALPAGAMLAVPLSVARAGELPEVAAGALAIAAENGPEVAVLAGAPEAVEGLAQRLVAEGVPCQRLAAGQAFHSPAVEAVRGPLLDLLRAVELRPPRIPLLSGVTGTWVTAGQATDPEHWWAHTRRPVRLAAALAELLRGPDRALLEVGPGQTLATLARQHPGRDAGQVILASAPHRFGGAADAPFLTAALGRLWLAGVEVDWRRVHTAPRRRVVLPAYPFERRRYWVEPRAEAPAGAALPATGGRRDLADWFYAPAWKGSPRPLPAVAAGPSRWLLLGADQGPGQALAAALRRRGREVIAAGASEDPGTLLGGLAAACRLPGGIVDLREAGPDTPPDTPPDAGFHGLLALVKALGELRLADPVELAVVTSGVHPVTGGERLHPRRATLPGACRVISAEYRGLRCRGIDLADAAPGEEEPLAEALAEELLAGAGDPAAPIVALRGGRRWVESFEPVRLDGPPGHPPLLREQGVYWITGGLGGIGAALALFLAREVKARLVLTSRSALPPRERWQELLAAGAGDRQGQTIRRLLDLEAAGAEVLVLAADAADPVAMRAVFEQARERFGQAHGVIHAAGVPGGGLIQGRTPRAAAAVLAPKVAGTLVLADLFRGRRLDFLALCSSLAAVQGGVGQADYCAANAFLDAFAAAGGVGEGTFTFSIGWDAWREAGMAVDGVADPELRARVEAELADALTSAEGVEVFRRALAAGLPHLLVSTEDLGRRLAEVRGLGLDRVLEIERERPARPVHARPALARPAVPPRDEAERRLAGLWEEVLGVEGLGVHDEFTELGGHSLLALQLASRVREAFGLELPMRAVFETPTVAGMAAMLAAARQGTMPPGRAPGSPLVAFRAAGSRPPLFFVHPAGGGVSGYRDLARHLGPDQPVYALQAAGLEDDREPLADVAAMAERYLAAVHEAAPAGPYHLAAWSLGGLIAYEMAQQLVARGEEVALLALLDAHVPGRPEELDGGAAPALLADLFHLEGVEMPPESLDAVLAAARRAGRIGDDFGLPEAQRLLRVFKANVAAVNAYVPRPYPGRIVLLRCREALPGAPPEPTLGWGALAAGGVEVHEVPGGHGDLVYEPYAAALAERLRACLAGRVWTPLTAVERQQVLHEWNRAPLGLPPDACLHGLFLAQAARTPDATALVVGDERLSYGELRDRAGRLAGRLRSLGVGPERLVGICLERSAAMVAALLAVLEAGGACLPLDPAWPAERLAFLLADSGAPLLLTEERLLGRLPAHRARVVCLDAAREEAAGEPPPCPAIAPGNLAYVIYTSGSTGRPKGVAITHGSAWVLVQWAREVFGPADLAGVFAATSICFDLSVFELFVPLAWGGTVILGRDALALAGLPAAGEVSLVNTVPSAAAELVRMGAIPPSVRTVNLAGEPLPRALAERLHALPGVARVLNLYGPSEDTTYSTWSQVPRGGEPTIGRPIAGTEAYLLDPDLSPLPAGVPGELCLGGQGLARGYLGRPELTAERFIPHPFAAEPGRRLYRTGDLARHRPAGEIEFLGRIDRQVKVRGFRIELGEVEAALAACPGVEGAAVATDGDGADRRLVAYVTLAGDGAEPAAHEAATAALRSALAARLPDPMVPAAFVVLPALPLTPNGKVDYKALPAPAAVGAARAAYARPRGPVEERLAGIWAEVLRVDQVGIHDGFFDLGGHSLLAPRLAARVRDAFGVELPPHAVLEARTVAGLAARLAAGSAAVAPREASPLVPLQPSGSRPPVFFLPPIGGGVASYADLARRLGPDQPSYGLQARGLLDDREPFDRLEPMAAYHLAAIRELVPTGPYLLAGWSVGGFVAYEAARQIVAAGGEVALLALLDTETEVMPPAEDELDDAVALADHFHFDLAPPGGGRWRLEAVIAEARRGGLVEEQFGPAEAGRLLRVFKSNLAALTTYVPQPYPGRVTLLRCRVRPSWETVDPADGWRPLALGGLEVVPVPGEHFNLVHEPHAAEVAGRLREAIDGALAARPAA